MNQKISALRKSCTTPVEYAPNSWKSLEGAGCYPYALNMKVNKFFLVGEFIGEKCNEKVSDEHLIYTLIKELTFLGFKVKECETEFPTKKGQFKIFLQREVHTGYYHFLREDSNGIWSHKYPRELPVQVDSAGQLIEDPYCMVEAPFTGWCFLLEKKQV